MKKGERKTREPKSQLRMTKKYFNSEMTKFLFQVFNVNDLDTVIGNSSTNSFHVKIVLKILIAPKELYRWDNFWAKIVSKFNALWYKFCGLRKFDIQKSKAQYFVSNFYKQKYKIVEIILYENEKKQYLHCHKLQIA